MGIYVDVTQAHTHMASLNTFPQMKNIHDTHKLRKSFSIRDMVSLFSPWLPGPDPWAKGQEQAGGYSVDGHPCDDATDTHINKLQRARFVFLYLAIKSTSQIIFFKRQLSNPAFLKMKVCEQLVFLGVKDPGTNPAILTPAAFPLLPAGGSFC